MAQVKVKLFGVFRVDTHVAETEIQAEKLISDGDEIWLLSPASGG